MLFPPASREAHCLVCIRSEEHTSELQSQSNLVCRLLLEKKKKACYLRPITKVMVTALMRVQYQPLSQYLHASSSCALQSSSRGAAVSSPSRRRAMYTLLI